MHRRPGKGVPFWGNRLRQGKTSEMKSFALDNIRAQVCDFISPVEREREHFMWAKQQCQEEVNPIYTTHMQNMGDNWWKKKDYLILYDAPYITPTQLW